MRSLVDLGSRKPLRIGVLVLLLFAAVVASACAPNEKAAIISPDLGALLIAQRESGEVALPVPKEEIKLASLTPEEINAGLPENIAAAMATADPARGQQLSVTSQCIACHSLDPAQVMTGPTWHNVGDTAANRVEGMGPALYLYDSIVAPSDFVVPNFPDAMLKTFRDTLSDQEIADLVAYLLAQNGQ